MRTQSSEPSERSYRAIADEIARRIETGEIPSGSYLPTERELQIQFDVSRTTIRRALAQLIENGIGESVPNKGVLVKGIQPVSTGIQMIAFIDGATTVLRSLYSRLSSAFLQEGFHLLHIDSQSIGLESAILFAQSQGCHGAFIWSFEGFPPAATLEEAQKLMPIVLLDHKIRGFESDIVTMDGFQMGYDATIHLAKSGRKRIAVTGMLDMLDTSFDRFSGYMRALFDSGLMPSVRDYVFNKTSGYEGFDCLALQNRLSMPDRPDAIFVMQDDCLPSVVQCILDSGLTIPDDVAIVTVGDDTRVSVGNVGISAIRCDWSGLADLAIVLMLRRLRGVSEPAQTYTAGYRLIVNGSCVNPHPGSRTLTASTIASQPVFTVSSVRR